MAKKNTATTTNTSEACDGTTESYLCALYDGCLKRTTMRFFMTSSPTPELEMEKFREHYGPDLRGKYIKIPNCAETYTKLRNEMVKQKHVNVCGDLFDVGVANCLKLFREVCGAPKVLSWDPAGTTETTGPTTDDKKDLPKKGKPAGKEAKGKPKNGTEDETDTTKKDTDKESTEKPATKSAPKNSGKGTAKAPKTPGTKVKVTTPSTDKVTGGQDTETTTTTAPAKGTTTETDPSTNTKPDKEDSKNKTKTTVGEIDKEEEDCELAEMDSKTAKTTELPGDVKKPTGKKVGKKPAAKKEKASN